MSTARQRKVVGSGITERTKDTPVLNAMTPDQVIGFFQDLNSSMQRAWGSQASIIAAVRAGYEEVRASQPDIYDNLDAFNTYYEERVTEAWYLKSVSMYADIVEKAVAEGRPWQAVAEGMLIGELLTELRMKFAWEEHALRGRRTVEAAAEGGRVRKGSVSAKHAQIAADYREAATRLSDSAAKNAVATKHGICRRTLNRIIASQSK